MKKKIVTTLLVLVVLIGGAGAGGWYYYTNYMMDSSNGEIVYVTKIKSLLETSGGIQNRYAGVVEPQETVSVNIESGRKVNEVQVQTGESVKKGQLLFEYDLSSIQQNLQEAQLSLERLKNEALSLEEQIKVLEAEKKKASANNQLSYTIEIETNRMNLKKNEYDQKSKQSEIERLQSASTNTEVRSEIDGIIQKIDTTKLNTEDGDSLDSGYDYMGGSENENGAFITILSNGSYRVKGMVNEQNIQSLSIGEPVIIRSRVDENQTWKGTLESIDRKNTVSSDSESYYGYGMGGDASQTSSSKYPFYITMEENADLMLGQHVYIEMDQGQEDEKIGVWLNDYFIVDLDTDAPYVWVAGENDKLEKRAVVLGQYDETMMMYEIADGLTEDDYITFPAEWLEEGMKTVEGRKDQLMESTPGDDVDMDAIYGDPEDYEVYDMSEDMAYSDGEEYYYDEDYIDEGYIDEGYIDEGYIEEITEFSDDGEIIEEMTASEEILSEGE